MLGEVLGRVLFGQSCAVKELALQQGQVGLQKWDDKRSQWEVSSFLQFGMKFFNCQSRVHQSQYKGADSLSDLW